MRRRRILRDVCEQIAEGAAYGSAQDYAAVQRFVSADLSAEVRVLVQKYSSNDELVAFLLRMVWLGQLQDTLPEVTLPPQWYRSELGSVDPRRRRMMRKSRFSEDQIFAILREQEAGMATSEVCRRHGISSATFYAWKSKYGGLEVSEAKRLKALEDENRKLKKLLAEAMLDNAMLKDLNSKKW